ncbi:hypothetical protein, partial [Klebsiella pneumoniae]|uniref:hypothetical protein n=1 Tax=Klebsiella pneumoniae TaxID=573 RepID=UPI00195437F9
VAKNGANPLKPAALPAKLARPEEVASMLRGAVAVSKGEGRFDRMVSDFRTSDAILEFVNSAAIADYAAAGVSTPDLS